MDRWIRWTTKGGGTSLWHRAPPARTGIRVARIVGRQGPSSIELIVPTGPIEVDRSGFETATVYRTTACGFRVPPYERLEAWSGVALPPLPRCIWCMHRWIVDTSPPGGAPPSPAGSRVRVITTLRGKKPPTLHA